MIQSDKEVLEANQQVLDSIASGRYEIYKQLCGEDLTCFEPESNNMLVEGLSFHKFYFDLAPEVHEQNSKIWNITMSNPHIRWVGKECVIVSYMRVDQVLQDDVPVTKVMSETRVWEVRDGNLVNCHFHKS
jgi:calcium/calmodulin-dependent protein kinase (CaM kinase) II